MRIPEDQRIREYEDRGGQSTKEHEDTGGAKYQGTRGRGRNRVPRNTRAAEDKSSRKHEDTERSKYLENEDTEGLID